MLDFDEPVVLVGGGRVDPAHLRHFGGRMPCVAADSGADTARSCGLEPLAIIGDLDSISAPDAYPSSRLIHTPDQAYGDFDKALAMMSAPLILGLGFLGRRLDHTLAAMNTLAKYHPKPVILLDRHDAVMFCRGDLALTLTPGARVSIWPLKEQGFIASTGLKWPLDGLAMTPGGQIGTSNEVESPSGAVRITAQPGGSGYLVILEAREIKSLIRHHMPLWAPPWVDHIPSLWGDDHIPSP